MIRISTRFGLLMLGCFLICCPQSAIANLIPHLDTSIGWQDMAIERAELNSPGTEWLTTLDNAEASSRSRNRLPELIEPYFQQIWSGAESIEETGVQVARVLHQCRQSLNEEVSNYVREVAARLPSAEALADKLVAVLPRARGLDKPCPTLDRFCLPANRDTFKDTLAFAAGLYSHLRRLQDDLRVSLSQVLDNAKRAERSPLVIDLADDDYWQYYADCDRWKVVFVQPYFQALARAERNARGRLLLEKSFTSISEAALFPVRVVTEQCLESCQWAVSRWESSTLPVLFNACNPTIFTIWK